MTKFYKLLLVIILMISAISLHSQYSLWTWGSNNNGQLGNDRAEDEPLPILINEDGDWDKVYPFYAIKKDGTLWTWGNRNVNYINDNQGLDIRLFDDSKWEKIITTKNPNSYQTTYGIKQDGSLWSWGVWHSGWVITEHSVPTKENSIIFSPFLIDSTHNWKGIEISGRSCVFGIDENGFLFTWGDYISLMGIGELEDTQDETIDKITRVGNSDKWKKISSLYFQRTFGIQDDGSLWLWGGDSDGLIDTINKNYYTPIKIGDYDCVDIRTNHIGTIFINSKGEVYSIGTFNSVTSTKPNKLGWRRDYVKIVESDEKCFAIQHEKYCAFLGNNLGLKFGKNITDGYYNNFIIPDSQSLKGYKDIAQIGNGFIYIDSLDNLRAWGNNSNGELGNGKSSNYNEAFRLVPNRTFSDISCGVQYSLAIDEYGMMWAWGSNKTNGLGIEDIEGSNKLALVDYDADWEKVYTFRNSNFASKTDGTLWAWGDNENGQLGVGHNNPVSVPTRVEVFGPWREIHSTKTHTLAIKEDGTLWAWGDGPLGLDTNLTYVPMQVNDDTDWTDIGCGDGFSVAVKSDMSYWCWGGNHHGVFGDYKNRAYDVPIKVLLRYAGKIVKVSASDEAVVLINSIGNAYMFSSGTCGSIDEYKFDPSTVYTYSNYYGYNLLISNENILFVSTSSLHNRPAFLKSPSTSFYPISEEKDWVKATCGESHILALREEVVSNIDSNTELNKANVYPNPSVSNVNIDFDTFYNNIDVSVYDVYGKLVLEDRSNNTDRIIISHNLPNGTYIIQCRHNNSLIVDQVLVVEK